MTMETAKRCLMIVLASLIGVSPIALTGCQNLGGVSDLLKANQQKAAGRTSRDTADDVAETVARKVSPSVVAVITRGTSGGSSPHDGEKSPHGRWDERNQQPEGLGSGVVYRSDGYIITNAHVIMDKNNTFVGFLDGSELKAKVVGEDNFSDIAILKVDRENLPVPKYGKSNTVKVGQIAIAIGNPFGLENTVTQGIISATRRSIPGGAPSLTNMLQTDAAISPGNSGGALVNKDAQVIGITTAFIPPEAGAVSLGFAVPVDVAKRVATQLISKGKATHAFMGITAETLDEETAKSLNVPVNQGAVVKEIVANGPAADAGIEKNDVIVKMDGLPIRTKEDVFGVVNAHAPGDEVDVEFFRGRNKNAVTVTLGEKS